MTRDPSFDELVGGEPTGTERERLRRAHELLVQAGPPPELSPELRAGPQLARVQAIRRRQVRRRGMLLLAATLAVAAVFAVGYAVGNGGSEPNAVGRLALKGTAIAPHARATLAILPRVDGNWPMQLTVENLPKLPTRSQYAVYLVQQGERYPCGSFVSSGGSGPMTVKLNAPYRFQTGASWIVVRKPLLSRGLGQTVLRPA